MLGYVGQESALARVPFASLGLFYTLRVPELVVPLEIDIGYFSYEWSSFAGNVENVVHAIPIVVSTGYEIQLIAGQLTLTPGLGVGYGLHLTSSATTDEALQARGGEIATTAMTRSCLENRHSPGKIPKR